MASLSSFRFHTFSMVLIVTGINANGSMYKMHFDSAQHERMTDSYASGTDSTMILKHLKTDYLVKM